MKSALFISLLSLALSTTPSAAERASRPPSAADLAHTPVTSEAIPLDSIAYVTTTTTANLVGATVTNFGFIGNNFVSRAPSFEYPFGTGYEHLVSGGLWIGAQAIDANGAFTGVTAGCFDVSQGLSPMSVSEFTPAGNQILVRSTRGDSPFYDPAAVSERDLIGTYSDRPAKFTAGSSEMHRPLGVLVRQENYSWSYPDYQSFLIYRFVISNTGPLLANVWVGLYTQFASGSKNNYSAWPPTSSSGGPLGSWYSKKLIAYEDSLRLLREHYCYSQVNCLGPGGFTVPYWAGLDLLTPPGPGQHVTFKAWSWSPGNPLRDQDTERYALMSSGTIQPIEGDSLKPQTGDPVELLALGPFTAIAPGDNIVVDFALVAGAQISDIEQHARDAQLLYSLGYVPPTTPTLVSLSSTRADPDRVSITWHAPRVPMAGIMVYRSEGPGWTIRGEPTVDGEGRMTFEDRDVRAGGRYGYRLGIPSNAGVQFAGEVWVNVPRALSFGLRPVYPNPSTRTGLTLSFSLTGSETSRLDLFDAAGRRVASRTLGSLGGGDHLLRWEETARLSPGIYVVQLTQGTRKATTRAIIVR